MRERINSPATKTHITLELGRNRRWRGVRDGIILRFHLSDQPDMDGRRVEWQANIAGKVEQGKSGTVTEALDEIATLKRPNPRR
jgi:hypothetical protein